MQTAEQEMQRDPELALRLLNNIQPDVKECSENVRMKWEILRVEALDKQFCSLEKYKPIIESLVAYYEHHGTVNDKLKAYYYMGGAYRDSKDPFSALTWYQKAVNLKASGNERLNGHQLSVIYAQMGGLMVSFGNMKEAQLLMKKSAECETDSIGKYESYFLLARAYKSGPNVDSAAYYYDKAFQMALRLRNRGPVFLGMIEEQLSYFIDTRRPQKIEERLPYLVKNFTPRYEGAEYYLWGQVFRYKGQRDSAEIYMKKAAALPCIDSKVSAFRQLMLMSMEQGRWKEAAEYGKSFAACSDSLSLQTDAE